MIMAGTVLQPGRTVEGVRFHGGLNHRSGGGTFGRWARRTLVAPMVGLLAVVLLVVLMVLPVTLGCNIDTRDPFATFSAGDPELSSANIPAGSYFGYSVLQIPSQAQIWWLLVGAPRADTTGAVFKCRVSSANKICQRVIPDDPSVAELRNQQIVDHREDGWLGVTLTKPTNKDFPEVTMCGHRFGNNYVLDNPPANTPEEQIDRYVQGLCYTVDIDFDATRTRFNPCGPLDGFRDDRPAENQTLRWQGWCQFGMSAAYTVEEDPNVPQSLVAGSVGSFDWTGSMFTQDLSVGDYTSEMLEGDVSAWNADYSYEDFYQYIGYSSSVGHFMLATTQEGATGAPRAGGLVGRVYIYDLKTFSVYQELQGEMMNTYFGGAIEALDINNDGMSDLLVGAPLYSQDQDEGRVYVYMNRGGTSPLVLHQTIDGTSTPMSRFGHVITTISDIGNDGFEEVAIGAPYEGGGVVYIYQSTEEGIDLAYLQRIDGRDTDPSVVSFGSSISGGHDFDSNTYPDIAIGAYANDTAYLYKTRPLLDLMVNLTVSPDPMDPENPTCRHPTLGACLKIDVCFNYIGPVFGALPQDIEVIYNLVVDKTKIVGGSKPRFLIEHAGQMVPVVNETKTIYKAQDTCFNYTAYLQTTASDFLSAMPVDLTYILMEYPVEPPSRGDASQRFPGGLSPVMKSYQCAAITKSEDVNFVRDCGQDAVCETDIRLVSTIEIEGNPSVIIVGGPSKLYIDARVENLGEEAHQAFLTIKHAHDMRYEGLETNELTCISDDGTDLKCNEKQVLVTCEPSQLNFNTSVVICNLGNPMRSYTASTLRLRFDIGGLAWGNNRFIPVSVVASTSSVQANEANDVYEVSYRLAVEADVGIFGSTSPESVYYSSNSSRYADDTSAQESLDAAVNMALSNPSSPLFNGSVIGAAFSLSYRITNDGAGVLPFTSLLTINIPWRTIDGSWLVYIKSISITDTTGTGTCNSDDVLALQGDRLVDLYVTKSRPLPAAPEEDITRIYQGTENTQQMGCSKAKCVALTCHIDPLQDRHILEVRIEALQWEHTLITRELGYVEILTEAELKAQNDKGSHGQGEDVNPDRIQLPIKMFTDMAAAGSVPIWVIIVSILGGILLLVLLILLLYKCGFFKRKTREDWEKDAIDGGAAPMPIKPPVAPTGEMDGSDLPMMKGPAAME